MLSNMTKRKTDGILKNIIKNINCKLVKEILLNYNKMDEYDDYYEEYNEEEEEEEENIEIKMHNLECQVDNMIHDIYREVIEPYLESHHKEILTNMDQFSSLKFYNFFIKNSSYYKRIINYKK